MCPELSISDDDSVDAVFALTDAAARSELSDDLIEIVQSLGREGSRRLELLFKKLSEEELDTDLTWNSPSRRNEVFISKSTAGSLSSWLSQMTPEVELITVDGYLRRADTLIGAFTIEAAATSRLYEGSGYPEALAHLEMDALYRANIEHEIRTSPHTSRKIERFKLLNLTLLTDD